MLALASCNSKDDTQTAFGGLTIIDVDNPVVTDNPPIGDLIDTAFVVQLKGDDLLISRLGKVLISDDRIFVLDNPYECNEPVKIFDREGNLIRSLHRGGGPGELDDLSGQMLYDEATQTFYVANYEDWSLYDKDGNYKGLRKFPFHNAGTERIGDEFVFWLLEFQVIDSLKMQVMVTDTAFNYRRSYIPFLGSPLDFAVNTQTPIFRSENHVTVIKNDTVYAYENSQLTPRYYFNYADHFDIKSIMTNDVMIDITKPGKGYLPTFYENSKTVCFTLSELTETGHVKKLVFDKKSGNYFVYPYGDGFTETQKVTPFFLQSSQIGDDYFIVFADDAKYERLAEIKPYLSDADKAKVDAFQLDDNPMLVFFKFKEF